MIIQSIGLFLCISNLEPIICYMCVLKFVILLSNLCFNLKDHMIVLFKNKSCTMLCLKSENFSYYGA